jgi:hypothetical protein
VANPSGSVTGGGWFMSPEGAYDANTSLTGKANFGFVSVWQKGKSAPTGETTFQFQAAGLNFKSTNYSMLVTTSDCAKYWGNGTVNGGGEEKDFILSACDRVAGDTFRIQIPGVYDNFKSCQITTDYCGTEIGG